jgi:cation diffusion facilitator CzcD-associated flavoprotein CzcO
MVAFTSAGPVPGETKDGTTTSVDVVIIGSGFAGLCMGVQLSKAGIDSFLILERDTDVGGTWRDNTYPGCECDIPSHLYSFSFDLNPDWSKMYPTQPEIWKYLQDSALKHGLLSKTRFDSEVREAAFDEDANVWKVSTADGFTVNARVMVSGMGGLSRPNYPRIPGIDRFEGPSFHSSEWDHSVDFSGKRVAAIGTGASSIQFVPQVAPQVDRLHVFQRSAPWVLPKPDRPIRGWEKLLFRYLPGYMRAFRHFLYWRQEIVALGYTRFPMLLKPIEAFGRRHLAKWIPDAELRARLTPDYTMGCKRTLLSNNYLPALARPNVEVVTEGITEVRERSVVTADGTEREVDVLIFGTGFRSTDLLSPVRFVGRDGVVLNELWKSGPEAYYGVTASGFPNLFFLIGPNSRVANNSIVFMIEAQAHYVIECLEYMHEQGKEAIEARPEAQAEYNEKLQERMKDTVFVTGCKNWYRDAEGRNPILWPSYSFWYWMRARRIKRRSFLLRGPRSQKG